MKSEDEEEKEILNWLTRREWHEQDLSTPRRSRYMADVRHPLKAIPLVEKARPRGVCYRPAEARFAVPESAPCGKCGQLVRLSEFPKHGCFGPRFPLK